MIRLLQSRAEASPRRTPLECLSARVGLPFVTLCLALAALVSLVPSTAVAGDVQQCLDAATSGQRLRRDKKLLESRDQFRTCAALSCPGAVQRDCAKWLREVEEILPSVSFSVQSAQGKDIFDVRVSMDGEPLVEQLDGSAVAVNPGRHTFVFSVEGHPDIREEVLVSEGDRARKLSVRLTDNALAGSGEEASANGEGDSSDATPATKPDSQRRYSPWPFVVGGVGVVALGTGVALFITGKNRFPESCRDESLPTGPNGKPLCPEGTLANSAITQQNIGTGMMIGGGVLLAGGITWFLIETFRSSEAPRSGGAQLRPSLGLGHVGLEGSF